jgi:hypothetical protein
LFYDASERGRAVTLDPSFASFQGKLPFSAIGKHLQHLALPFSGMTAVGH